MKIVIGRQEYPLGDLTRMDLGEQRTLKRILGVPIHEVEDFDPRDPDVAVAMVWLALHRNRRPHQTVTIEHAERIHPSDIEVIEEPSDISEEVDASPPDQPAAETDSLANGSSPSDGNGGTPYGSETTPDSSGVPTSSTGSPT